jgi:hypothetical protein
LRGIQQEAAFVVGADGMGPRQPTSWAWPSTDLAPDGGSSSNDAASNRAHRRSGRYAPTVPTGTCSTRGRPARVASPGTAGRPEGAVRLRHPAGARSAGDTPRHLPWMRPAPTS